MISIEAARDGFALSVHGRRILSHSHRKPCIEIGESHLQFRDYQGIPHPARRRCSALPLRSFKVLEAGADIARVEFDERFIMTARLVAGRLRLSFQSSDRPSLFRLRLQAFPEERIYGGGQRAEGLDLKGRKISFWVNSSDRRGPGNLRHRVLHALSGPARFVSAFPMPVFISSSNYWGSVDTEDYTVLDFRSGSTSLVEVFGLPRELVFGAAPSATGLLADLSESLGRQLPPPAWSFEGIWVGFDLRGGGLDALISVERQLEELLEAGLRVGAISLSGLGVERAKSEEAKAVFSRLGSRGLRILGEISPLFPLEGRVAEEARESGFLVQDSSGKELRIGEEADHAVLVDLSKPEAFAWMKSLIHSNLIEPGLSGWSAEGGEYLRPEARLHSKLGHTAAHNLWPLLWAQANEEAIEEAGGAEELLFTMRTGWLGSSRLLRIASARERLDGSGVGLKGLVSAALSLGLSGMGYWQVEAVLDGGGGKTGRQRALAMRWMEMAAFSPFFSVILAERWRECGLLSHVARMSEIYASLKPYHATVADEYRDSGLPMIRHPYLHYESQPELHAWTCQYLYGRDLLVAPAYEAKNELVDLYLPTDEWIHLWSSRRFGGGAVTIEAPSGFPAVFYRADSRFASLFDAIRRTLRKIP